MTKKELIEQNKNLIQQNGEMLYLLEFGKLRCVDSKLQMIWERDSNARVLQQENTQLKEVIKEVWNFIKSYPGIAQSGVMSVKEIIDKEIGEDK